MNARQVIYRVSQGVEGADDIRLDSRVHPVVRKLIELDLSGLKFEPSHTFDCGQVFRWRPADTDKREWIGIIRDVVVLVTKSGVKIASEGSNSVIQNEMIMDYFTPNHDLDSILHILPEDDFLTASIREFPGLRLLTQDPWECLISFVCSINKNIPGIRVAIENLCARFGSPIYADIGTFYSFPTPDALAHSKKPDLLACKVGFRWKYIKYIAQKVASEELDLNSLRQLDYEQARKILVSKLSGRTFGVGPKVADCALLFSLQKTDAFPIDVWMIRCIRRHYADLLGINPSLLKSESLSSNAYSIIAETMRTRFGKFAGYAQQYLYMKTRNDSLHSK